jgi:hypothetical protein
MQSCPPFHERASSDQTGRDEHIQVRRPRESPKAITSAFHRRTAQRLGVLAKHQCGVGVHRLVTTAQPLPEGEHLFTFVR